MSIDSWMDKDVVHGYLGTLFCHKKEWNNAICSNTDGCTNYHTNWSKSVKDKYHMISLICGIFKKKWYKWTYLQNRNRFTDLENELVGTRRERLGRGIDLGVWDRQVWVCGGSVASFVLTVCNPMDCSPSGSSVHGILQARILEWIAIPFSRESSRPRKWT